MFAPIDDDPNTTAQVTKMGFNGTPGNSGVNFTKGWKINVPVSSNCANVKALMGGRMEYFPNDDELRIYVEDPMLAIAITHGKPNWSFLPSTIIYKGLDVDDLKRTMKNDWDPNYFSDWEDFFDNWGSWNSVVDDFASGGNVLAVQPGEPLINVSGTTNSSDREFEIYALATVEDSNGIESPSLYYNLSCLFEANLDLVSGLDTHTLKSDLIDVTWPAWSGAKIRYVSESHSNTTSAANHGGLEIDYFCDPNKPALNLKEAVEFATKYDTVLIIDERTYTEGEIKVQFPLTIAGLNPSDPTQSSFSSSDFPVIKPSGSSRVFLINPDLLVGDYTSLIQLFHLTIQDGYTVFAPGGTSTAPTEIGGAGIGILDCQRVRIERCFIHGNTTKTNGLGTFNIIDQLDDKIQNSTGMTKDLFEYYKDAYQNSKDDNGDPAPTIVTNHLLTGQSFGGGICIGWSDAYVRKCKLVNNKAGARGGGIAVIGYGWPVIEECKIDSNNHNTSGRRDGGGIALEISIPDKTGRTLDQQWLLNQTFDFIENMDFLDVLEFIYFILDHRTEIEYTEFLDTIINKIDYTSWDSVKDALKEMAREYKEDYIAMFMFSAVDTIKWELFEKSRIKKARRRYVHINKCTISNNTSADDGGGIYASVMSKFVVSECTIEDNEAIAGSGGGIRATMGSNCLIRKSIVFRNKGLDGLKVGGGGVGFRNVFVQITESSTISFNEIAKWAGGGLVFDVRSEGGAGMWQAILALVFELEEAVLSITDNSFVINNKALDSSSGKGGGIYTIRSRVFGIRPMILEIEDFNSKIALNDANENSSENMRLVDFYPLSQVDIGDSDPEFSEYIEDDNFFYD